MAGVENVPVDLLEALNYGLYILGVLETLPKEYRPKTWQLLFEDEVERCIDRYMRSFKADKNEDATGDVSNNALADELLKKYTGRY